MTGIIVVDVGKCTGCQACMLACSLVKENVFSPSKSRIQVLRNEAVCLNVPVVCEQCEYPLCMGACPVEAISKDSSTGMVKVDDEICMGCGLCVDACYYGAIRVDPDKNVAVKCDLCGGDPQCVKVCTFSGAIRYVEGDTSEIIKERQVADKRAKAYLIDIIVKEVC